MTEIRPDLTGGKRLPKSNFAVAAAVLFALSSPALAAPGDMSVGAFLAKAEALKKKGPLALMSRDVGLLKGEVQASGQSYRERIKADKAAGRKPHSCPPEKASMNSDDLLAHLRSYPAASRKSVSMNQAFSDLMKTRYPCG